MPMTTTTGKRGPASAAGGGGESGRRWSLLSGAVIAIAAWLGVNVALAPVAQRAPPEIAVRIAPGSPAVLSRAAESEYVSERFDNAWHLSGEALARAPFDVRAMRVRGLADARLGNTDRADALVTIAGNWSLRDDAAHGWLIQQRLRQGDYASAFAHADTLARRREAQRPLVFQLFTAAGSADSRAIAPLAERLATRPFWRWDYLKSLQETPKTAPLLASLAISLEQTSAPLDPEELEQVYTAWAGQRLIPALKILRGRLGRPALSPSTANAGFETPPAYDPFDWHLATDAAVSSMISEDELRSGRALRTEQRGGGGGLLTRQLLLLEPGDYRFSAEVRTESGSPANLRWSVICFESETAIFTTAALPHDRSWREISGALRVPTSNCTAQWLLLRALSDDFAADRVFWFDNVKVSPAG